MYDVLEGLAKSLVGLGGGGRARYTVLRLTDVLGLSEEGGEAPVDLYERASRPLIPRSAPSRDALRGVVHIGVDSSSRALSTPAADVAIAAASVSGPGPVELCDYPSLYPRLSCEGGGSRPSPTSYPTAPLTSWRPQASRWSRQNPPSSPGPSSTASWTTPGSPLKFVRYMVV